jgi:hypothetical protein
MASVYAVTALDLSIEEKKRLFAAIEKAPQVTFTSYGLLLDQIPVEHVAGKAKSQVCIYICVPPYMQLERRRKVVSDINRFIREYLKGKQPDNVVVMFKHHADDCCGVSGVLRSDSKQASAATGN